MLKAHMINKFGASAIYYSVMTNEFLSGSGKKTYADCIFLQEDVQKGDYCISASFEKMLENPVF